MEFYGGPSLHGEDHNVVLGQKFPSKTEAVVASSNPEIELMADRWFKAIKKVEELEETIFNYKSNV